VAIFFTDDAAGMAMEWKDKLTKLGAKALLVQTPIAGRAKFPQSSMTSADPKCQVEFHLDTEGVWYDRHLAAEIPLYVQKIDSRLKHVSPVYDGFYAGCGVPPIFVYATYQIVNPFPARNAER
jgi:hypothetical protein